MKPPSSITPWWAPLGHPFFCWRGGAGAWCFPTVEENRERGGAETGWLLVAVGERTETLGGGYPCPLCLFQEGVLGRCSSSRPFADRVEHSPPPHLPSAPLFGWWLIAHRSSTSVGAIVDCIKGLCLPWKRGHCSTSLLIAVERLLGSLRHKRGHRKPGSL